MATDRGPLQSAGGPGLRPWQSPARPGAARTAGDQPRRAAAFQRPARGLVLLALLIMLALVGVGALAAAEVWATTLKRERETELLFIGEQYRRAIENYWKMSPGRRAYPPSIDVLLNDDRFPTPVHHLRRKYRDPMTESGEFEPLMMANGVTGIHTTSADAPMKHANFPPRYKQFADADSYAQWQFVFSPRGTTPALVPGAAPNPNLNPTPMIPQGPAPGVPLQPVPSGR